MFIPVYRELSEKLHQWIVSERISGKLPGVVQLGKQFGANPATVVKALKILEKRGLLEISPSSGSFVHGRPDSDKCDHTVCILGNVSFSRGHDRLLDLLNEFAAPYHFRVIILDGGGQMFSSHPWRLADFPADAFAGFGLTQNLLSVIRAMKKPVISLNACFGIPEVSSVDFDWNTGIEAVFRSFRQADFRRIGIVMFDNPQYHFRERMEFFYTEFCKRNGIKPDYFCAPCNATEMFTRHGEEYHRIFAEKVMEYYHSLPEIPEAIYAHIQAVEALFLRRIFPGKLVASLQDMLPDIAMLRYSYFDLLKAGLLQLFDEYENGIPVRFKQILVPVYFEKQEN